MICQGEERVEPEMGFVLPGGAGGFLIWKQQP